MLSCAELVFADVSRTTGLEMALSPWDDPDNGIGAVLHEATARPEHPVWDAVGYLGAGDCLALHPVRHGARTHPTFGDLTSFETTTDIADVTQQLVLMLLWERGLDATWPFCPEHPRSHPLRVGLNPVALKTNPDMPSAEVEPSSVWLCPVGDTKLPVGNL